MVDNLSRGGDPGRPPQALSPARAQPGPQEAPYLGIGKIFDIIENIRDPKFEKRSFYPRPKTANTPFSRAEC